MKHDVWVEVDLAALKHNLRQVKTLVGDSVQVMAVVKANGFGHGYVQPARAFVEAGADALAVTRLDEAVALREGGVEARILLFAPVSADNADQAVSADLDLTVTDLTLARAVSQAAQAVGKTARVHLKVDTGMGRLGVYPEDAGPLLKAIATLPGIEVAGVYTHFATAAEKDLSTSIAQLEAFTQMIERLRASGIAYGIAHAANSAAIVRMPEARFSMVRPGTLLYGQYPSAHVPHPVDLRPTWRLKARICDVRTLPVGSRVGYGGEFVVRRETRTAVVPIGYADGLTLAPEGPIYRQSVLRFAARKKARRLCVEIRGKKAPVLGRVAMQMIVVDVSEVDGVSVGDEVTIPAMRIPTSALIPRVYAG